MHRIAVLTDNPRMIVIQPVNRQPGALVQTVVPGGKRFLQGDHVGFHLFWETDGSGR